MIVRRAILLVLVVGFVAACDRERAESIGAKGTEGPPPQTSFEVDGEGVFYVTVRPDGRLAPGDYLSEIPTAERGLVGVHVDAAIPEELARKKLYAADLLDARPGDKVRGELRSFDRFKMTAHAASLGGHRAAALQETTRRLLAAAGADPLPEERRAAREARAAGLAPDVQPPEPTADEDGEIVIESLEELEAWTDER